MNRTTTASPPTQALLLGHLMHRPGSPRLQALVEDVTLDLDHQSSATQVQVHADLCAQLVADRDPASRTEGLLLDLMIALDPGLARHARCSAMFGQLQQALAQYEASSWIEAGPALAALPAAGQPWSLSEWHLLNGLCEMRRRERLTPAQASTVIDRVADLLRHLLAIAPANAAVHPVSVVHERAGDAVLEAFTRLAVADQIRLLRTQPHAAACAFIAHLAQHGGQTRLDPHRPLEALIEAGKGELDEATLAVLRSWLNILG